MTDDRVCCQEEDAFSSSALVNNSIHKTFYFCNLINKQVL